MRHILALTLLIFGMAVIAQAFIAIAIATAMLYGNGRVLIDFNSKNEGWLEFGATAFGLFGTLMIAKRYTDILKKEEKK